MRRVIRRIAEFLAWFAQGPKESRLGRVESNRIKPAPSVGHQFRRVAK